MGNKLHLRIEDLLTITSKTPNQSLFLSNYHKYQAHLLHGCAGTGKSLIAIYRALEDVLDKGTQYRNLVIIRSPVAAVQIGALPGTLEEKGSPFEVPYYKITKDLFNRFDAYSRLKEQNVIHFFLSSHLRGDTMDNAIILVDEIQNMKYQELYTIITRVGLESKIIFCGDNNQTDINQSGLRQFMIVLDNMRSVHQVQFGIDDVVRSGLVKEFLIAEHRIKHTL